MNAKKLSNPLIKEFNPDIRITRSIYIKWTLIAICSAIFMHLRMLYPRSGAPSSPACIWSVDVIIITVFLIIFLRKKIPQQFILDFTNQKFIVNYLTISKDHKGLEIPFDDLSFSFNLTPIRSRSNRWTLLIFYFRRQTVTISTKNFGFSQQTLEDLVGELRLISKDISSKYQTELPKNK
jgi:hypothetical protein